MLRRDILRRIAFWISIPLDLILILPFILFSMISRLFHRKIDVGLGSGLINDVYHKKALIGAGYSAQTFAVRGSHISKAFDILPNPHPMLLFFVPYYFFARSLFRYKALFIYFNGGPLATKPVLRHLEPFFFKLAGIKIVAMPYGSDVQVMPRSKNFYFKHTMTIDYPSLCKNYQTASRNIDRWTKWADWIISGCEWVDYMVYWDTLTLGHFSIDMEQWSPAPAPSSSPDELKILHAPNHRNVKGTDALLRAVELLRDEGLKINLTVLSKAPNEEVKKAIASADLVADQFVVGWYAMFSIEAMSMDKPVLCYLRDDLLELYTNAGLLEKDEIPLINTPVDRIAEKLRWAYHHRNELHEIGKRGRTFVARHHPLDSVGTVFAGILSELGIRGSSR